jgi:hypothetical protein
VSKKYYYLKKGEVIKLGDQVKVFSDTNWQSVCSSIGNTMHEDDVGYFRREIKQPQQPTKTKISRLKLALLKGDSFTPVSAGKRFGIQHNTFNKFIWVLKHEHGMDICSGKVKGKDYKKHWIENN